MREIKFRAWNKNLKKMYKIGQITLEKGTWNYEPDNREYIGMSIPYQPSFVLMQYTGLKDKNGKEIYEGDIVTCGDKNIKYLIEWQDTGLKGRQWNNSSYIGLKYWQKDLEVIGNEFDNPELLGGKKC